MVHLNVSIDSLDPVVYERIRKTPITKALAGLGNLARVFDRRRITVGAVIMSENIDTIAQLPPYLASLGIGKLQINALHEHKGRHFAGDLAGGHASHVEAVAAIRKAGIECNVQVVVDVAARLDASTGDPARYDVAYRSATSGLQTRRCLLPWEFPFIDKDGNVFLCCNATGKESETMGSLLVDDFEAIWHGERYRDARARFLEKRPLPESCARCTLQELGEHPLNEYRAEILPGSDSQAGLRVRNIGSSPWLPDSVRVGTARPRDRTSTLHAPTWRAITRVSSNAEPVPPGATTTFALPLADRDSGVPEIFQLVVERKHWIPNTEFTLSTEPANAPGASESPPA
jgi:radical SAM protein with 4Fe4S-binding SPASM domain